MWLGVPGWRRGAGAARAEHLPHARQGWVESSATTCGRCLESIEVGAGPPVVLRVRTRFDPQLGNGRPEEVVAALADELGHDLVIDEIVRERLVLT